MSRARAHRIGACRLLWLAVLSCGALELQAQLIINTTQPPTTLVQNVFLGPGVFASNVTFNGTSGVSFPANPIDASRIGRFNGTNANVGFTGGIILANGDIHVAEGPNDLMYGMLGGGFLGLNCDLDLAQLSGGPDWMNSACEMNDVAMLEFDFIPIYDMVRFRYVFGSEEYESYACSEFNDIFGFFLSGPGINGPFTNGAINIALVPSSQAPVAINTVNSGLMNASNANGPDFTNPFGPCFAADPNWQANAQYYRYNGAIPGDFDAQTESPYCCDPYHVQYNGLTVPLEATAAVQCGRQYHVKLAVANRSDHFVPSAVFLEHGSFSSSDRFGLDVAPGRNVEFAAADTTFIESGCDSVYLRFHRRGGFYLDEYLRITTEGSATAGVDYMAALPDSIHFNQQDTMVVIPIAVPVDADGVEELVVKLITCNGLKIQIYRYLIDQRPPLVMELADVELECPATVALTPTVIGGSSEYEYLWSIGATTPSISVDIAESTQYWVRVSDCWAGEVTDSAWVYLPQQPGLIVDLPDGIVIPCLGMQELMASVEGAIGDLTYSWMQDGEEVGTAPVLTVSAAEGVVYSLLVTDDCGRRAGDSVVVHVGPTPPLTLVAVGDTVMCAGGRAVLQVLLVTGGGGAYSYDWNATSPDPQNGPIHVVIANGSGFHTVSVTDQCGNVADTTLAVIVLDHPPMAITLSGDTVVCPGTPVILRVDVSGGPGGHTVEWPGIGSGDEVIWTAEPPGIETVVRVMDACGDVIEQTVSIGVHQAWAEIAAHQLDDSSWNFEAITEPADGADLHWDLGDGTAAGGQSVYHVYTTSDAVWVVLYMVTPEGCTAVDSVQTMPPPATIYFPNAFSPNGDGTNESFGGEGRMLDRYELYVFDRWGRIVFESHDPRVRWDGTQDGEAVMNGVYQYKYIVKGLKMPLRQGFGHVTLIR